jgi:gliding motility-associated-like protein
VLSTGTKFHLPTTVTNGPINIWEWNPITYLDCPTCANPYADIKNDITYILNATDVHGCKASDTINIKVFCESTQVFIPNVFTPDNDGRNDILMVRGTGIRTIKYFRIFNRWGEIVFEKSNFSPNDRSNGWDGKIKGIAAPPDVYVYTCEVVCENGNSYIYKGNTSIVK